MSSHYCKNTCLTTLVSIVETANPIPNILDDGNLQINFKNSQNIGIFNPLEFYFSPNYFDEHNMLNMYFSLHPSRRSQAHTIKVTTVYKAKDSGEKKHFSSILKTALSTGKAVPIFIYYVPRLSERWSISQRDMCYTHQLGKIDQSKGSLIVSVYATLASDTTPPPSSASNNVIEILFSYWRLIIVYDMNFAPSWDFASFVYIQNEKPILITGDKMKSTHQPYVYPGIDVNQIVTHHSMNRRQVEQAILKQVQYHLGDEAFELQRLGMSYYSQLRP